MKSSLPVIEAHDFEIADFVAGDPALDFVNTVTARDAEPRDWLDGYPRLIEWAGHANVLPDKTLRTLARRAKADPAAARKALARAKALREVMYEILEALVWNRVPAAEFAGAVAQALARGRVGAPFSLRPGSAPSACSGRHGGSRPDCGDRRLAHGRARVADALGAAAALRRAGMLLALRRSLEVGTPPLVRHGGLRQRRKVAAPLRAATG